jgi:hypothetical protein
MLAIPWDSRTIVEVGAIMVLTLLLLWAIWWQLPKRQVAKLALKISDPKARADTEDSFRKTIGQALGGAAVLIGAGFAYLQFSAQQQATYDQLQSARDVLISNQVSKGFEQLAGDKPAMRLGGIYALEGVMNTSPKYHTPVLEALCAYVRASTTHQRGLLGVLSAALNGSTVGTADDGPPTDIQAALTVIARRQRKLVGVSGDVVADYGGARDVDLAGAKISGANLRNANLSRANLSEADLSDANLSRANLDHANMRSANLSGANLRNADLSGANLRDADLSNANLTIAKLSGARLDSASLSGANLRGVNLGNVNLSNADLKDADFRGGGLDSANLNGVRNLTQAQLDETCGTAKLPPDLVLRPCLTPSATPAKEPANDQ